MNRAVVGLGSCGQAAGAARVLDALRATALQMDLAVEVRGTGCLGMCYREVLVELVSAEMGRCLYGRVTPESIPALLEAHFENRVIVEDLLISRGDDLSREIEFLAAQERIVLRNCGSIDPESLDDYLAAGGYQALERVLHDWDPDRVIAEIEAAGLRGRGGAGFPTGRKWRTARGAPGEEKFIICNGDEGDPGAFMDRNLIEGDPFALLEGMTIAAYAIGARRGIVYVRDEYPLAVARIENAVARAHERGYLGPSIAGSGVELEIEIARGAGAFVCGEETALIASLEGRRGWPTIRPPYPVEVGLHGMPTVINNVETLANVPWIVAHGAEAFHAYGIGESRGTKVFSLAGDVRHTGMVEVPMGVSLREIVEEIGGGSPRGRPIKAVQIGGPAGGCLPASMLTDTRVDYESLAPTGAIMGSGGLVVMDDSNCMVDVARYFLAFCAAESCGKCTFCRIGTQRMLEIMNRLCAGKGKRNDLDMLDTLAGQVRQGSLCGLGKSAPNPVSTTLRYFRDEYQAHLDGRCPAGKCRDLITFRIQPALCEGCTLCLEQCPTAAISKRPRIIPLEISTDLCTRCGGCFHTCPFEAIGVH